MNVFCQWGVPLTKVGVHLSVPEQSPLFRVWHPLFTVLTLVRTLLGSRMPVDMMALLAIGPVGALMFLGTPLAMVLVMTRRRVVLLLNVPWTPRETVTE